MSECVRSFNRQTNGQDLAGFVLSETDGRTDGRTAKSKLERGEERRKERKKERRKERRKGEKFGGCKQCNVAGT